MSCKSSLTIVYYHIQNDVKKTKISGNVDGPEGTLDAMMQAIICSKIVGWRQMARKILLVTTDAGFHYAGDGKVSYIYILFN